LAAFRGGLRPAAAFASFAGVALIPASSGLAIRHRLNRGMRTTTLIRMRLDPARRISEGKGPRYAQRCLKGNICRQPIRILDRRNQRLDTT
jgi:hypothetical protein